MFRTLKSTIQQDFIFLCFLFKLCKKGSLRWNSELKVSCKKVRWNKILKSLVLLTRLSVKKIGYRIPPLFFKQKELISYFYVYVAFIENIPTLKTFTNLSLDWPLKNMGPLKSQFIKFYNSSFIFQWEILNKKTHGIWRTKMNKWLTLNISSFQLPMTLQDLPFLLNGCRGRKLSYIINKNNYQRWRFVL